MITDAITTISTLPPTHRLYWPLVDSLQQNQTIIHLLDKLTKTRLLHGSEWFQLCSIVNQWRTERFLTTKQWRWSILLLAANYHRMTEHEELEELRSTLYWLWSFNRVYFIKWRQQEAVMTKFRYDFIQPKRRDTEPYSKIALARLTHKYWREIRNNIIPQELRKFLDDNKLSTRLLEPTKTEPVLTKKKRLTRQKNNKQ